MKPLSFGSEAVRFAAFACLIASRKAWEELADLELVSTSSSSGLCRTVAVRGFGTVRELCRAFGGAFRRPSGATGFVVRTGAALTDLISGGSKAFLIGDLGLVDLAARVLLPARGMRLVVRDLGIPPEGCCSREAGPEIEETAGLCDFELSALPTRFPVKIVGWLRSCRVEPRFVGESGRFPWTVP